MKSSTWPTGIEIFHRGFLISYFSHTYVFLFLFILLNSVSKIGFSRDRRMSLCRHGELFAIFALAPQRLALRAHPQGQEPALGDHVVPGKRAEDPAVSSRGVLQADCLTHQGSRSHQTSHHSSSSWSTGNVTNKRAYKRLKRYKLQKQKNIFQQ